MVYLQDKNHFTALTAEPPHPRPRPGDEQSVSAPGRPRSRLPLGAPPHLHARSFPNRALKPKKEREKKRGKQNLIFMVN